MRHHGGSVEAVELASRAVSVVERVLPFIVVGGVFVDRGPGGMVGVDVVLMYGGVALDRVHFDPVGMVFSPKGRRVVVHGGAGVDERVVRGRAEELLGELRVLGAAEYREPERCWVVPVAWRSFIVAHVRVDYRGEEVVPDPGLTALMGGGSL